MVKFFNGVSRMFGRKPAKPQPITSRQITAIQRRRFEAAQMTRLTASWAVTNTSMDKDLYSDLPALRARSRNLAQNNEYARKFLNMLSKNIVGPKGFALKVKALNPDGTIDQVDTAALKKHFKAWSKKGTCDVTGKYSFRDIQHLFIKSLARDGEVLMRKVYGPAANAYGFALQILDIDHLDHRRNDYLNNGNVIKMGVEMTAAGRPVAYHLFTQHPNDSLYYTVDNRGYIRVPAEEIYHCFVPERPEQTRGIPWMHAGMSRLNNLGGYEEAAVIAARVGASKMGFFKTPDGTGEGLEDGEDATGQLMTEADPGVFSVLPEGYSFEAFDPDYPHAMYDVFTKACLRGIASALDVPYNELGNDLEGVNFSSIRSGTLDARDGYMVIQEWMAENFLEDVYTQFVRFGLLRGAITTQYGKPLPLSKIDKFSEHAWRGRRWDWVDPRADTDANVESINNRLRSRTRVMEDEGEDIEEVWAELAAEEKLAEKLGIILPEPPPIEGFTPPQPPAPAEGA